MEEGKREKERERENDGRESFMDWFVKFNVLPMCQRQDLECAVINPSKLL